MGIEEIGYVVIRNVIPPELASHINDELELFKKVVRIHQERDENELEFDGLVDYAFHWYGAVITETLLNKFLPLMEKTTEKKLFPSYSYYRIYHTGASMPKHKDRPACEYSMTLNLSNDPAPWAINITGLDGKDASVLLNPGDAMVYKGMVCEHWREEYTGNRMCQVFLHWVDQEGPNASWKYDGRKYLGLPSTQ